MRGGDKGVTMIIFCNEDCTQGPLIDLVVSDLKQSDVETPTVIPTIEASESHWCPSGVLEPSIYL